MLNRPTRQPNAPSSIWPRSTQVLQSSQKLDHPLRPASVSSMTRLQESSSSEPQILTCLFVWLPLKHQTQQSISTLNTRGFKLIFSNFVFIFAKTSFDEIKKRFLESPSRLLDLTWCEIGWKMRKTATLMKEVIDLTSSGSYQEDQTRPDLNGARILERVLSSLIAFYVIWFLN